MESYESEFLIIFESYNQAMLLYNELTRAQCRVKLISTPCGLSKGCSQSITFDIEDTKNVVEAVKRNNIKVVSIYKILKRYNNISYVPLQRI